MFSGKRLGVCGILVAAVFMGGCANRGASMRIVNETSESILLEPMVKTAFLSRPLEQIELGPGEEWQQSWDLERGSWVLVRFVRPSDINSIAAGSLHLRTIWPGQTIAFRATPDENGILATIVSE